MNMNQKGFANIILIVVIVVLVGAVGYFAFVKKMEPVVQQPTPSPTQNTQPTTPPPVTNTPPPTSEVPKVIPPAPVSSSVGSPITLISPNGGEKFTKGKMYKITWKTSTSFNSAYPQVSITLITAKGKQAVKPDQQIITNNTGSFEWTIPTAQLSGYIQDYSGGPYALRALNDQSEFQFLIEGYPHTTGRAEGPFDYSDSSFQIVSQ